MEWRKPKKLSEFHNNKLDHGQLLFIEEHDPKEQLDFPNLNWHKAMVADQSIFKIYVNVLGFDHINTDIKPLAINISKKKSLQQLKDKVAKRINASSDEFMIYR